MNRRAFLWAAAALAASSRRGGAQPAGRQVRIGVFGLFEPAELILRITEGGVLEADAGVSRSMVRAGEQVHVRASRESLSADHPGGRLHGRQLRFGGDHGHVHLELSVPGRIVRTFRGTLTVTVTSGVLTPALEMNLETAVASVVAAEATAVAPQEALRAQAVAARSYFTAARGRHRGFDFCDTTHCQFLREVPGADHPALQAARATEGLGLMFRGSTVQALYSASCGGRTRSLDAAGLSASGGYPFFAVDCAQCATHAPEWERRIPLDADAERLEVERSEDARIAVVRRHGWSAVPGLGFETRRDGDALVITGRGTGHGIGLCQAGATALAATGASFPEILRHYYPGTTIDAPAGSG